MREGPGSIPGLSMPMCACVCHSLPIPGLAGSLLRRAPNVAFQPQKLRFPRFSRPHSFVHSEHQPKECAGSRKEKERKETKKNKKKGKERRLARYRAERARAKGKGEGCHSHAPTLNEHSPSAFPLQAGGSADIKFELFLGHPLSQ